MAATADLQSPGLQVLTDRPGAVAVFLRPPPRKCWQDGLERAVESGAFYLPRADLAGLSLDGMATWLDRNLPKAAITPGTRDALISDLLSLAHVIEELTSAQRYRLRIFAAAPDQRCGYHVDTVPIGSPVWGILKVYNGAGTDWVAPTGIRSMAAFYGWLQLRDRIARMHAGDHATRDLKLKAMDERADFIVDGVAPRHVTAGTPVVFKHLPANRFWSDHARDSAWLHASPMRGKPRLVANISPHQPASAIDGNSIPTVHLRSMPDRSG